VASRSSTVEVRGATHYKSGMTRRPNAKLVPVLCYIATTMESRLASNEYIDRILKPARDYGFPAWYVHRLESFRAG
jgi:hypothetical protein